MRRKQLIERLESSDHWDICIIGGGATGLGAAVDAASRGFKTILVEKSDYAKGTSSRSTKLVHGGVRYLQQGNIKLVREALKERGILTRNAGHLVKNQSFIVPNYKWWEGPFYGIGLKVYDWMSGSLGLGPSKLLSKEEVLRLTPTLDQEGLRGGVIYHDGQFDDARLAINLAQTAHEQGALMLNYFEVTGFGKTEGAISSITVKDNLSGKEYKIVAKAVINATGVFSDAVQQLDDINKLPSITPSQGIHIVLDKSFLPGDTAIMVPHTDDGRVLFAVPWHNRIIVGTTDTFVDKILNEPEAEMQELEFLIKHVSRYLTKDPTLNDVKSIFAGLRPLVKSSAKKTAEISRDHLILVSPSGLISIVGGKWTTYRKMAEDVIDTAIRHNSLESKSCVTETLKIHGHVDKADYSDPEYFYGSDKAALENIYSQIEGSRQTIHPSLTYTKAQVIHAVQAEFCMTVEDFLSRRTRALLLDAQAATEAASEVAETMQDALGESNEWRERQVEAFHDIASTYLPKFYFNKIP
jgi:glycerol-3-phosphate dehydrogenase